MVGAVGLVCSLSFPSAAQGPMFGAMFAKSQAANAVANQPANPAAQPTAPQPQAPPAAIPLPEIAARSEDLAQTIRILGAQIPSPEQVDEMKATLKDRENELHDKKREFDTLLAGNPGELELREQESYWQNVEKDCADSRRQLLDWAIASQSAVQQLQAQEPLWTETLRENKDTAGIGPVLDLMRDSARNIEQLKTQAQQRLRTIVNLQVQAAVQDQAALDVIARLDSAHTRSRSMLERDGPPLWRLDEQEQSAAGANPFVSTNTRVLAIRAFARQNAGTLLGVVLLGLLSLAGAYRLYRVSQAGEAAYEGNAEVSAILRRWFALGLLPPLLLAYILTPAAPVTLIGLAVLLSFIPILRLLPYLIEQRYVVMLYWLAGVYAANVVLAWLPLSNAYKRGIQFALEVFVFVVFVKLLRSWRVSRGSNRPPEHRSLKLAIKMAVGILGLSLLANLFGYVRLGQMMAAAVVYGTFIALILFTGIRVFTLLLLAGLETQAAERLEAVRQHRAGIARWAPRVLQWLAVFIWLGAVLELTNQRSNINQKIADLLGFRIAGGATGLTLGGIFGFFGILLAGYVVSSVLRFLLREELLKRFHLSRGLPDLIASTIHYLLLLLVFFGAVNVGGIELNKFTLLTGALGVGFGFGLQNIVNNFVSGLILQFERPIHIGDVLEMDGATGTVTRIGIRSSTLQTFQGAEIIIPNANFISGRVINWTLSEAQRRVDLPVGVAYGTDAALVVKLLLQAATQNENVLVRPAPAAYFKEFGDSSVNYELQFWAMQESNSVKMKSEVGLEVMRLFNEAGIEIPFPQRDLRLRAVDAEAATVLQRNDVVDDELDVKALRSDSVR